VYCHTIVTAGTCCFLPPLSFFVYQRYRIPVGQLELFPP